MRSFAYCCGALALALASGCAPGFDACSSASGCAAGFRCVEGRCEARPDGDDGPLDAGGAAERDGGHSDGGDHCVEARQCAEECCTEQERCVADTCVEIIGECEENNDCASDSYCADGSCVPYGVPPETTTDEDCVQDIDIEAIEPEVQCRFETAGPDDPVPGSHQMTSTPLVVDFDFDEDPATLRPSIVFATAGAGSGEAIRVIDGGTCELQHIVTTDAARYANPALGDLDGDGRAEVVTVVSGAVQAFTYDPETDAFVLLWESATCSETGTRTRHAVTQTSLAVPSLHDFDDDGLPEVVIDESIYGSDGCLFASAPTNLAFGYLPVVADVDEDGAPEIVSSTGIYRYNSTTRAIEVEPYFEGTTDSGFKFAAVGDFGEFPLESFGGGDRAEIVIVGDRGVRVETIEGTRILTASLPSGRGGPPTVADFDGDGRAEFAAVGNEEYVVFDLDCLSGGDPAGCGGSARTDGRLWTVTVDEQSSGITGSSVFDFDADGVAEVIYHDECYLRIFSGPTGDVLFSYPRYSLTWMEMPVIADVDGDFHTEIVMGAYDAWTGSCPETDPYISSVRFERNRGLIVLRDRLDRWAASRPIWNQHAYSVTHVDDRGRSPRTSETEINWRTDGLNNFRQNVQGELDGLGVADLTSSVRGVIPLSCRDGEATVRARVCNRGRLPLGGGLEVALREGSIDGAEYCRVTIEAAIGIGECQEIACTTAAPEGRIDLFVVPDPDDEIPECHEANSWGVLRNVECVILD